MIALIVIASVVSYILGGCGTAYMYGRWGIDDEVGSVLGPLFWPLGLTAAGYQQLLKLGEKHKGEPLFKALERRREPKALPPPPCRCNGGTEPCKLPPQQAVYR